MMKPICECGHSEVLHIMAGCVGFKDEEGYPKCDCFRFTLIVKGVR